MYYNPFLGWPVHGIMMLGIFLPIALLFVFAVWNFRKGDLNGRIGRQNAIDLLDERYAKGEIDGEEYRAKKKDLQA